MCVKRQDKPIKESLRSEAAYYNTDIDAPIRIHKYNADRSVEAYDDDEAAYNKASILSLEEQDNFKEDSSLLEDQDEMSVAKRDNIKDTVMDLERINLYSERTKRDEDPRTLDDLIKIASSSSNGNEDDDDDNDYYEEVNREDYNDEGRLSNLDQDYEADYIYDLDNRRGSDKKNNAKGIVDLTDPSEDYKDDSNNYAYDFEDEGNSGISKRSSDLIVKDPGIITNSEGKKIYFNFFDFSTVSIKTILEYFTVNKIVFCFSIFIWCTVSYMN